ncbi:MAG TPA: sulfite exporter TauE/SafE family protein, partial [Ferruginibacter sp.]|nr:sulfite exporter TauE/SafE family protein [Ferruginibacter sp.]
MVQLITAAMVMGMLGSLHCVGMCGPLVLSLPVNSDKLYVRFIASLLYNVGRITTYSLIGLFIGAIGQSFAMFGFQQWLSIGLGISILFYLVIGKRIMRRSAVVANGNFLFRLRRSLAALYNKRNLSSLFLAGVLNGFLPCGLVYLALAGAAATGNIYSASLFMAAFGFGTLPLMWAVGFFGHCLSGSLRTKLRSVLPFVTAFVACILILRGIGLGIPYVSPKLEQHGNKAIIE